MINFESLLIKWNNGVWRGAQTNFAQKIGVKPNTVSQWIKFKKPPDRDLRDRVARKLGISVDELLGSFMENAEAVSGRKQLPALVEAGVSVERSTMGSVEFEVTLKPSLFVKLRALAQENNKEMNDQMELILEQWFAQRERQSDVVPDASGNTTPGPQPFATPRHRRSGEGRPSGRA